MQQIRVQLFFMNGLVASIAAHVHEFVDHVKIAGRVGCAGHSAMEVLRQFRGTKAIWRVQPDRMAVNHHLFRRGKMSDDILIELLRVEAEKAVDSPCSACRERAMGEVARQFMHAPPRSGDNPAVHGGSIETAQHSHHKRISRLYPRHA